MRENGQPYNLVSMKEKKELMNAGFQVGLELRAKIFVQEIAAFCKQQYINLLIKVPDNETKIFKVIKSKKFDLLRLLLENNILLKKEVKEQ